MYFPEHNILTEFDQEKYDRCRRREGYEDGIQQGKLETARKMLADGISVDAVAKYTDISLSDISKLQAEAQSA